MDFDMHWKSRIAKARKALGALSGVKAVKAAQWERRGWKKTYEGMTRTIATWGVEVLFHCPFRCPFASPFQKYQQKDGLL